MLLAPAGDESVVISYGIVNANIRNLFLTTNKIKEKVSMVISSKVRILKKFG